ncbi:MAG TPA: cytochrome c biogenesis protein ResB [Spirochaetia bacterium]|nr:cytochrome c biogenesis protein ResB [Spirochaetia bacterium]
MNAVYRFFKSVRLAIVVILLITALSLLSTLVPQGRENAFYQAKYSPALYALITTLDFNRYFSSVLFIIPVVLFSLNLGVCAADRLIRRTRMKAQKRFGPDIVHIALLVLVAGGLVTALGRHETDFSLGQGQEAAVTPHYSIKLLSFEYLKYENGSPKAWISTVDVLRDGILETAAFPIRVNHPLRLKGVSVYQSTWDNQSSFVFRDSTGAEATARIGQGFQDGDSFWYLADVVGDGSRQRALFQQYKGNTLVSMRELAVAETLGPYTLVSITQKMVTGLRAVSDPGFVTVVIGVALLATGLALTFLQNSRGESA